MKKSQRFIMERHRRRYRHRHHCRQQRSTPPLKEYIKPLSNYDILDMVVTLKIPHFIGVFMRDTLLKQKRGPAMHECWILNHGSSQTDGTHWTALAKNYDVAFYFDSFGKLPPPLEVIEYLGDGVHLYYNVKRYQEYGTTICGHLCMRFLHDFWQQQRQHERGDGRKNI